MTITVNVPVELDDQFFEDIIVTMLEGGSNYWVDSIDIGGENQRVCHTVCGQHRPLIVVGL